MCKTSSKSQSKLKDELWSLPHLLSSHTEIRTRSKSFYLYHDFLIVFLWNLIRLSVLLLSKYDRYTSPHKKNGSHGHFFSQWLSSTIAAPGSLVPSWVQVTACVEFFIRVSSLVLNIPLGELATLNCAFIFPSRVKSRLVPSIPSIDSGSTQTQPKHLLKINVQKNMICFHKRRKILGREEQFDCIVIKSQGISHNWISLLHN